MLRRIGRVVALLLLVVLAAVAWLGWTGLRARDDLLAAADGVTRVQDRLLAGDVEGARTAAEDVQVRAAGARDRVHDPVWAAATAAPVLGDDAGAVRTGSAVVDDVARDALVPLVDAAAALQAALEGTRGDTGDLDPTALDPAALAALADAGERAQRADAAVARAQERLAAVPRDGLVPPLRSAVADLEAGLDEARATTQRAASAGALVAPAG